MPHLARPSASAATAATQGGQRKAWNLRCGSGKGGAKGLLNVASLTLARAGAAAGHPKEALDGNEWYESVDDLKDGSYGKEALRRRFNDLDSNGKGFITSAELKVALEKLQLPATDESVHEFMAGVITSNGRVKNGKSEAQLRLNFHDFANFALQRERELLKTFQELDSAGNGFLTENQLKQALVRMGHSRVTNDEVGNMLDRIKTGQGAFSKGKGLLGASNDRFVTIGRAVDFAEFRDFLMLSNACDMRGALEVWGRAMVDIGDVPMTFPAVSQKKAEKVGTAGGVLKHLLVGAVSGGVSRSVVAPLERVKIEYMVDSSKIAADGGVFGTVGRIFKNEGFAGLFKGNALNVCRIAPTKAVEFFCYDKYKEYTLKLHGRDEMEGHERMIGGSLASMAGTALTHPVDTLRSRVSSTGMPVGEVWRNLIQAEGPMALWKGLGANMVRVAPYGAINFFVYDWCKSAYRRYLGPETKMTAVPTMIFGGLAGAAAQTGVYPLEMVQRRIQVQGMKGAAVVYKNMFHGIYVVAKTEGFAALYAGLLPNYAKILPAAAVSFYVYEWMKERLNIV